MQRFIATVTACQRFGAALLIGLAATAFGGAAAASSEQSSMDTGSGKYMVILGASYAKSWPVERLAGMDVINTGVSGQESTGMLERFESDVVERDPDAVVIWGFINDVFRGERSRIDEIRDRAYQNLVQMVERARAADIEPILATEVTIRRRAGWIETAKHLIGSLLGKTSYQHYVNTQVRRVNERLRKYAEAKDVTLLDFERVLADEDGVRRYRFASEDGSHLSAAAYDALTAYARETLESSS